MQREQERSQTWMNRSVADCQAKASRPVPRLELTTQNLNPNLIELDRVIREFAAWRSTHQKHWTDVENQLITNLWLIEKTLVILEPREPLGPKPHFNKSSPGGISYVE